MVDVRIRGEPGDLAGWAALHPSVAACGMVAL
jgi:hypothetical protein